MSDGHTVKIRHRRCRRDDTDPVDVRQGEADKRQKVREALYLPVKIIITNHSLTL